MQFCFCWAWYVVKVSTSKLKNLSTAMLVKTVMTHLTAKLVSCQFDARWVTAGHFNCQTSSTFVKKPCTFMWLYVRCLVWLASTLFKLGNCCYHIIASTECLWNTSLISQFLSHVLMLSIILLPPSLSTLLLPLIHHSLPSLSSSLIQIMQINGFNLHYQLCCSLLQFHPPSLE